MKRYSIIGINVCIGVSVIAVFLLKLKAKKNTICFTQLLDPEFKIDYCL